MRCTNLQSPHPKTYIIPPRPFLICTSDVHPNPICPHSRSDDGRSSPRFMHVQKACVSDWIWRAFRSVLTAAKISITRRRTRHIARLGADREVTAARVEALPIEGACEQEGRKGVLSFCECVLAVGRGSRFCCCLSSGGTRRSLSLSMAFEYLEG